jgi:hypothetical protein
MAIFNSYVSLPEGKKQYKNNFKNIKNTMKNWEIHTNTIRKSRLHIGKIMG